MYSKQSQTRQYNKKPTRCTRIQTLVYKKFMSGGYFISHMFMFLKKLGLEN